ncbi:MAG: DUF6586 family protein [Spongiibacteraceae bacterium]
MNNDQRPVVNQRLYFCRLHLQWLSEQLQQQILPQGLLNQCLGESVLLHLVMAYRAYLVEIAAAYSIDTAPITDVQALIAKLEANGKESAEAKELLQLTLPGQWLSDLLEKYQAIGPVSVAINKPGLGQFIAVREIDSSPSINWDCLQSWLEQLNQVIANQRARLEEW